MQYSVSFISSVHMSFYVDCESVSRIVHVLHCKQYGRCGLLSVHLPALCYLRHTLDFDMLPLTIEFHYFSLIGASDFSARG